MKTIQDTNLLKSFLYLRYFTTHITPRFECIYMIEKDKKKWIKGNVWEQFEFAMFEELGWCFTPDVEDLTYRTPYSSFDVCSSKYSMGGYVHTSYFQDYVRFKPLEDRPNELFPEDLVAL